MRKSSRNKNRVDPVHAADTVTDTATPGPPPLPGNCLTCGNAKSTALCRGAGTGGKAYGPRNPALCGRYYEA